jgi:hypothetical protein
LIEVERIDPDVPHPYASHEGLVRS